MKSKIKSKQVIPIMFCFDNNYVVPAAVAFYSLLDNANNDYFYEMYVLHSDITEENQNELYENISKFSNICNLHFVNIDNKYDDIWQKVKSKGHFSKEIIYKLVVASCFLQYDNIILSDVDVVFLDDISKSYIDILNNDDNYIFGVKPVGKILNYMRVYDSSFSKNEVNIFSTISAGYLIYNLKKIRDDKKEVEFIQYLTNNSYRLNQPEQDVLNICCYPKIGFLSLNHVMCSYAWDLYKSINDLENDVNYTKNEIKNAMDYPVQLHYATSIKPWKNVDCIKSEVWFSYICKTTFSREFFKGLPITVYNEVIKERKRKKKEEYYNNRFWRSINYIKKNPIFFLQKKFYVMIFYKIKNKFMNGKEK